MHRFALAAITLAVVVVAGATANAARQPHPWCLIVQDQDGVWACVFDTFEQCSVEARAGNTGFCAANPAYQAPAQPARPKKRRRQ